MKIPILLVASLLFTIEATAQSSAPKSKEEVKLIETLYFNFNQISASKSELTKLDDVVDLLVAEPTTKVKIEGYGDPAGGEAVNERMSLSRAKEVAAYLIKRDVKESQISVAGHGIDTSAQSNAEARRVDVSQIITVVIEEAPKPKPQPKAEPKPEPKPEPTPEPTTQSDSVLPSDTQPKTGSFSLRTNLLYWLVGNINLGAEWNPNNTKLGILINGGYSPFEKTEWNHNLGSWFVAPEVRYYLGEREAWFVGAQFLAGGYNYKLSDTGYIGSMIGGGVTGGYKLTLSESFDMDFSLGLGYGTLNYDTYYKHDNGTNVYIDKDVTKNTFMPVQLGVSLIFKL